MIITGIKLQNYRSYKVASFEFEEGVNIVVGPNTSGKTNLLEAILLVATGKSYRGSDERLVHKEADWGRLEASTDQNNIRVLRLVKDTTNSPFKTFEIDDKKYKRLPQSQFLPVVLFEPNQLQFLTTLPEQRRNVLDDLLEQTNPLFRKRKNDYIKTLRQRNALLKNSPTIIAAQMFAWDIRLSELAGQIVRDRQALITTLNQDISQVYSDLSNQQHQVSLRYVSKVSGADYASSMNAHLEAHLSSDIERGFTSVGPHRDDIVFAINGADIAQSASRGEVRTILLALKLLESRLLEASGQQKPLLLFDDVFGELDGTRRKSLTSYLKNHQTFITTTDADVVGKTFTKHAHQILL